MAFMLDALLLLGGGEATKAEKFVFSSVPSNGSPSTPEVLRCLLAVRPLWEARRRHTLQDANTPRREALMNENDNNRREAEQHLNGGTGQSG
jgi:hypothetical protein